MALRSSTAVIAFACITWGPTSARADRSVPDEVGVNIARGAACSFTPAPDYAHCTDAQDKVQLTDGQLTEGYFWTQPGTVGWQRVRYACIVVDLGAVQPIQGASFRTAAGVAGVFWPAAIRIQVSDDGRGYRDVGDLIDLDSAEKPPASGYGVHRYTTLKLATRGRYVRFLVIPAGPYVFTDEIEVFRGPAHLLEGEPGGEPVTDIESVYSGYRVEAGIRRRYEQDLQSLHRRITAAGLPEADMRPLLEQYEVARTEIENAPAIGDPRSFRTVIPFNGAHARLFQIQARLWRLQGHQGLQACPANPWEPLDLFGDVSAPDGALEVHTMLGEYRAAALNLSNSSDRPVRVRVRFADLPESPAPDYLTVHEVAWTDTVSGQPVAAALPEARREDGGWSMTVQPGLPQQVWLTCHATALSPGAHSGEIVIDADDTTRRIPLQIHVYPLTFPRRTSLWVGGWSYTDGDGRYGITPANRQQLIAHLQERFVNAPWATSGVLMRFSFDEQGGGPRLDTARFDEWVAQWPEAIAHLVFLSVGKRFAGTEAGTDTFNHRVGSWIRAWADHLRTRGMEPGRLGLLLVDEPRMHEQDDVIIAWARAIKAAEPEMLIWEDPVYRDPRDGRPEMFEVCDILCPNRPMWLSAGQGFSDFYLDQQKQGRTLQLYSCSGPARLLDPYAYYRLQAWHAWQIGATGSFFWAFGDNSQSSSWNEYAAVSGPYTPLFLDDETVTPAKQMEAIRESVEDYEYLVMLRDVVDRSESANESGPDVQEARRLLRTAADEVLGAEGADRLRWHEPKDRGPADALRIQVLQVLARLSAGPRASR